MAAVVDRVVGGKDENDCLTIGEDISVSGEPFRNMSDPAQYDGYDYFPGMSVTFGLVRHVFEFCVS
jgi:hypothetical protein